MLKMNLVISWRKYGVDSQKRICYYLCFLFSSCVTLDNVLLFLKPQFPYLENVDDNSLSHRNNR